MLKKRFSLIAMATIAVLCLTACWVPEKFTARIVLDRDGSYTFTYDGTLVVAMARAAAVQGKLSAKEETDLKRAEQDFRKDPSVKRAVYLGRGTFQVLIEKHGHASEPFYFFGREEHFIAIKPSEDGTVEISGVEITDKGVRELAQIQVTVDGILEVQTTAPVLRHNAAATLPGKFRWKIKDPSSPPPQLVARVEGLARAAQPAPAGALISQPAPVSSPPTAPSAARRAQTPAADPAAPAVRQLQQMTPSPTATLQSSPLTLEQVRALIQVGAPDARVADEITNRGLAFVPAKETLSDLRKAGAGGKTLDAVESFIPLLDEARKQIPPLLDTLFKELDTGNRSALTPLAFKELLDDARRLDSICAPFSYQAHYLDSLTEPQRRVFHAVVHVLTKDSREHVALLEFAPVGEKFLLRNVLAPAEVFRRDVVQQAVDAARQLLYAVCARRLDLLAKFATPGLLRSIEFARFGDERGWPLFTDCSYAQIVTEQVEAVNYSGLKLKTTLRPSGRYNLSLLLDQVDGAWKVVRMEKPTYPVTVAEDPEIRSYVLKRFRVRPPPMGTAENSAAPTSEATWKPLYVQAAEALKKDQFAVAFQFAELALAAGATGHEPLALAGATAFLSGEFARSEDYSLRAIQAGGQIVFIVRHRHLNLLGPPLMPTGRLFVTSAGVAFQGTECSDSFAVVPFAQLESLELRSQGFLLHLEVPQAGKSKKRGFDFGDTNTHYVKNQNQIMIQYTPGREQALAAILRVIHGARAASSE